MMDAVPAAMLFGEISTQSHVRPRISPIHILHAKDVLIANIKCEKNRLGIPDFTFWGYSLRNRAWRVGFFSISSYFCLFLPDILSRS